jgi:GTPase
MSNPTDQNYRITKTSVAFCGSVDAGKSSLLSTITYNILDDGRGSARALVAKHEHEIKSGKTSDISTRTYDVNDKESITFVDLCGHEKYLKTTNYGLASHFPDYGILVVSSNRGMLPMTRQHLRLLLTYNIPFIIVVTHIDQMQDDVYSKTMSDMTKILKKAGGIKTATKFVNDAKDQFKTQEEIGNIEHQAVSDILDCLLNIPNGKQMVYPVVSLSNKTGVFLNIIKNVLKKLPPRSFWTPGNAEMVTQNKIVKQQLNSLERQYDLYKTKYDEEYRQSLLNDDTPHPDILSFVEKQKQELAECTTSSGNVTELLVSQQEQFHALCDQLADKFNAMTTEDLKTRLEKLQPVYREFTGGIFYVDSACNPPGTQLVLTGINRGQRIAPADVLHIGPFGKQFLEVRVKTLHNNVKQFVPHLDDHDRGCVSVAPLKKADIQRKHIRKGTIALSSPELIKNVCYRFKALIKLFDVSVTMKTGTTPVIHLGTIAQSARMIVDPNENGGKKEICFDGLTTSVAVVTFKFKTKPEFIEPYNLFVLRSGDIQGLGMVIDTLSIEDDLDANPDPVKPKRKSHRKNMQKGGVAGAPSKEKGKPVVATK